MQRSLHALCLLLRDYSQRHSGNMRDACRSWMCCQSSACRNLRKPADRARGSLHSLQSVQRALYGTRNRSNRRIRPERVIGFLDYAPWRTEWRPHAQSRDVLRAWFGDEPHLDTFYMQVIAASGARLDFVKGQRNFTGLHQLTILRREVLNLSECRAIVSRSTGPPTSPSLPLRLHAAGSFDQIDLTSRSVFVCRPQRLKSD